jgi:hypothetical protein
MENNSLAVKYCTCCKYRQSTLDSRDYQCSLTNKAPDFEETCSTYWEDPKLVQSWVKAEKTGKDAAVGKKRFFYSSAAFVGINILAMVFGMLTFYNYQNLGHLKAIIRLVLELIMLFGIYNGNSLPKHVLTALCVLGVIITSISIPPLLHVTWAGLTLVPLAAFYLYAIYFLNIDRYFLAYFNSQKL